MAAIDLEEWNALGELLRRFVRETEDRLRESARSSASRALDLIGVSENDPARALAAKAFADLSDPDVRGAASSGELGLSPRMHFRRLLIASELLESWVATDDAREHVGDPWESFWESIEASSLPWPLEPPEGSVQALAQLAEEISAAAKDAKSTTWPVFPTGEDHDELVAETLAGVSARTGISLDSLPVAPPTTTLNEIPMMRTDAGATLEQLHEWASEREDLVRALGVVRLHLRLPR